MRSLGWLDRLITGAGMLVVIILAPIAAVYWFATGKPVNALIVLGVAAVVLLAAVLRARDLIPRSRRDERRRS